MTTKAQGVVYLVILSLYEGLANGDSLPAFERRTRTLWIRSTTCKWSDFPGGHGLYHPSSIDFFLDQDYGDQNFTLNISVKQMPMVEVASHQDQLRRRMNGRCKGLLEVCKNFNESTWTTGSTSSTEWPVIFSQLRKMSDFLAAKAGGHAGPSTLVFKSFVMLIESILWEEIDMSEGDALSMMLGDAIHYAR